MSIIFNIIVQKGDMLFSIRRLVVVMVVLLSATFPPYLFAFIGFSNNFLLCVIGHKSPLKFDLFTMITMFRKMILGEI